MFDRPSLRRLPCALALLSLVMVPAWAAAQATDAVALDSLRREVLARFEVVPLRAGVALAGRTRDRRVEVVDGLVLAGGTPLSGAELRDRLGADAALILRLSYLDNATLRQTFAPPPAAVPPAVAAPEPAAPRLTAAPPPPAPAPPMPTATTPDTPPVAAPRTYRRTSARLSLGKTVTVREDEEVTEGVVSVGGNVRIAGRVRDEIVVLGGNVDLAPTADVVGDITAIGGVVTIAPGARHRGEIRHPAMGAWSGWNWPLAGWSRIDLDGTTRWLTLAWTLTRVGLLAAVMGLVVLLAGGRIGRIGAAATSSPLRAGAIGFGMQVVFVPALVVISVVLAITIVGLPFIAVVIPLALVAMFLSMLLGFTSLAHALGRWAGRSLGWSSDAAVWAAVLGLALIVLPTVVSRLVGVAPEFARAGAFALLMVGTVVEYAAWTIGLGAAVMTGFGRFATVPPPLPPTVSATDTPLGL